MDAERVGYIENAVADGDTHARFVSFARNEAKGDFE